MRKPLENAGHLEKLQVRRLAKLKTLVISPKTHFEFHLSKVLS